MATARVNKKRREELFKMEGWENSCSFTNWIKKPVDTRLVIEEWERSQRNKRNTKKFGVYFVEDEKGVCYNYGCGSFTLSFVKEEYQPIGKLEFDD